jgi:hypothetical protein
MIPKLEEAFTGRSLRPTSEPFATVLGLDNHPAFPKRKSEVESHPLSEYADIADEGMKELKVLDAMIKVALRTADDDEYKKEVNEALNRLRALIKDNFLFLCDRQEDQSLRWSEAVRNGTNSNFTNATTASEAVRIPDCFPLNLVMLEISISDLGFTLGGLRTR